MWIPQVDDQARASYPHPVAIVGVDPLSAPCKCVQIPYAYLPLVVGALTQLVNPATWSPADESARLAQLEQVEELIAMIALGEGCQPLPPAPPVPPEGEDIDCKIASYIVGYVARKLVDAAIDRALGSVGWLGKLVDIAEKVPGAVNLLGLFGVYSGEAVDIIHDNPLSDWAEMKASDALWNWIGCMVYSKVQGVHGFTAPVVDAIKTGLDLYAEWIPGGKEVVQLFWDAFDAVKLNALAEAADLTTYECSGCTDEVPVITGAGLELFPPTPLEVTDGVTDLLAVSKLTLDGATLSGTAADATVTVPPGLPDGTRGDLLRHDGESWKVYPIGAGIQGQRLTNDADNSGLPIWEDDALQTFVSGTHTVVVANTTAKIKNIGATEDPDTEQPGWKERGFDDSSWVNATVATHASFQDGEIPTGADSIWDTATRSNSDAAQQLLVRKTFTVPAGLIVSAQLTGAMDAWGEIYVNGTLVGNGGNPAGSGSGPITPIDVTNWLSTVDTNVIAVVGHDLARTEPHKRWVTFRLDVEQKAVSIPGSAIDGGTLELTDGVHDLTGVSKVSVSGLTVGGSADDATLTVNPLVPSLGDFALLAEHTCGGAEASISLADFSADYHHLKLVVQGRMDTASYSALYMRFNSDAGSHYDYMTGNFSGGGASYTEANLATEFHFPYVAGTGTPAGGASTYELLISGYAQTFFRKEVMGHSIFQQADSGSHMTNMQMLAGEWTLTVAITSIQLWPSGGNWVAGTTARLYGLM